MQRRCILLRQPYSNLHSSSSSCSPIFVVVYTEYNSVILFLLAVQGRLGISFCFWLVQHIALTKFIDSAFVWENDLIFQ